MTTATPLAWPEGWPRTPIEERSAGHQFTQSKYVASTSGGYMARGSVTFAKARDKLFDELKKLGATSPVVSTNHPTDRFNLPVESKRRVTDEGVAVYFQYRDRPMVMACDRYETAAANMRSLGLAIEALRQLERHGGGTMMERAFAGFSALPPPRSCWDILGIEKHGTSAEKIRSAWRGKIAAAHPDKGGSDTAAAEINRARDEALAQIGA
jgi:hypothetical protein